MPNTEANMLPYICMAGTMVGRRPGGRGQEKHVVMFYLTLRDDPTS